MLEQPAKDSRRAWSLIAALVLLAVFLSVAAGVGGEIGRLALAGVQVVPLLLLAALLQLGTVWSWMRQVAWVWFWLVIAALVSFSVLLTVAALLAEGSFSLAPEDGTRLLVLLGLSFVGVVLAVVLVVSGQWRRVGEWFGAHPLPGVASHAQGVVGLLFFTWIASAPLIALGGEAPLLKMIAAQPSEENPATEIADLFYSLAWMIPLAFVGAGLPVVRGLRGTLDRLGIGRLNAPALGLVTLVAAALVGVAFGLDAAIGAVWEWAGWPRTDAGAVEQLFKGTDSLGGALSVGITAGVGEELIARGLLQPRFGWLLPNLAFAAAHAYQYGTDGLLSVFVVGAVMAAVRTRWNTTAAAYAHGLYDFLLVMGGVLNLPGF